MKKQFLEGLFLYPSFSYLIILYTHLHKQLLVFKLLLPRFLYSFDKPSIHLFHVPALS